MKPGQSYDLLIAGVAAGKAVLGKNESPGYLLTPLQYSGTMQPHGHMQAFATSVVPSAERPCARQAPTDKERSLATRLARVLFERAGISESLIEKIKVENLTETIVAPSKSASIIGSFSVAAADFDVSGISHNLFFIASVQSGGLESDKSRSR
jgi:hypothetical protein